MKKRLLGALVAGVLALSTAFALTGCDNPLNKEKYTPQSKDAAVSAPAIGVDGTLRVGVNTGNPPFAGQASKIVGVDVDIAAAIADEWGLKLEIVDVGSNPLVSLQQGAVDMVLGVDQANNDSALWKSSLYIQTGIALFALDANAGLPTKESKIAAQATSMSAWAISSQYGEDAVTASADLKTAFANLADGTVSYVASDAVIGQYAANTAKINAHIVGLASKPGGYCAATLATNTALTSHIETTIKTLSSNGTIALIEKKWLGSAVDLSKTQLTPEAGKSNANSDEKASEEATEEKKDAE